MKIQYTIYLCLIMWLLSSSKINAQCWEVVPSFYGEDEKVESIYFVNENVGWLSTIDIGELSENLNTNFIYKTIDGGETWSVNIYPDDLSGSSVLSDCCNHLDFINEEVGWSIGGAHHGVHRTLDGGQTWEQAAPPPNIENPKVLDVDFVSETTGWMKVAFSGFYRTTNGGASWEEMPLPYGTQFAFVDEERGWLIGEGGNGSIRATQDGGYTWVTTYLEEDFDLVEIFFLNDQLGWVVGERGDILRTVNGGADWEHIPTTHEGLVIRDLFFVNDTLGWINGGTFSNDMLMTKDGGETWLKQAVPGITAFKDIHMTAPDKGWAVTTDNYLLRYNPQPACSPGQQVEVDYSFDNSWNVELMPTIGWEPLYGCVDGYNFSLLTFSLGDTAETVLVSEDVGLATEYEVTTPLPADTTRIIVRIRPYNHVYGESVCSLTESAFFFTTACPDLPAPIDTFICEGESFYWDGHVFEEPGVYEIPYLTTKDCDSTITLNLQWFEELEQTIIDTAIVAGGTFQGQVYEQDTIFLEFLSAASGCDSIVVYSIDILTSTNEVEEELLGEVYPNPVEDELFVLSKYAWQEAVLYDIQGRRIKEWTGHYPAGSTRLDMSNMQGGMYVLQIQSEQGRWVKRIVVE